MIFPQIRRAFLLAFLALHTAASAQQPANPNDSALQVHLGSGYDALKLEQYETAEKEFRAALAIDPNLAMRARFPLAVSLFEQHKFNDARQELQTVQQASGEQSGISYYLGRINLEEHDYKAAIDNLSKAAPHAPFPDTAFYLGLAYVKEGSNAEAETWLKKAIRLNPDDSRAEYELATLYRKEGRQEDANQIFQQAKEAKARSDKQSQLKFECGQALDRGSLASAAPVCDQLYDPHDIDKLTSLGILYGQHGYLEQALKPLQRAAELAPQSPQMQYNLAFTYFQLKRYEDASKPLAGAIQRWPDLFPLNALYGTVLWNLGEVLPAYDALHHAHELNAQDAGTTALLYQCTLTLASRSESAGDHTKALLYLQEAAALNPKVPEPHQQMATIYKRMGRLEQAKAEEQKAAELTQ